MVYLLQLLALVLAFGYGYAKPTKPWAWLLFAVVDQLAYTGLIAWFYQENWLSVFDVQRLVKEHWLPTLLQQGASYVGHHGVVLGYYNRAYLVVALVGGFICTLAAAVDGGLLRRARLANKQA